MAESRRKSAGIGAGFAEAALACALTLREIPGKI